MTKTLSIIIPSYNEGEKLYAVLERVQTVELPYGIGKEIIVVDDGSTDNTADYARQYIAQNPGCNVRLLRHSANQGKGMAIRTAITELTGDIVVIQDSDAEYDPNDLARMLKKMEDEDLQVLYGSRYTSHSANRALYRSFYCGTKILSWLTNVLYGQHITDEPTCYKMFRTPLLRSIPLKCRGFEFCPEVTAKVARRGLKIREVPISYAPRTVAQGKKIRAKDGLIAVWCLLKYRFVK
jgi:dolichol-phosphate mannosyltransferase